jgi:5-methylcytosine-specific restriction endonuclease McrA
MSGCEVNSPGKKQSEKSLAGRKGAGVQRVNIFPSIRRTRIKRGPKAAGRAKQVSELDQLLRAYVLERDGHACVRCAAVEGKATLQSAHVRSKGKGKRIRFEPDNLMTLCVGCHIFWWHKSPHEAVEWFSAKYPGRYERLLVAERCAPKVDLKLLLVIWRKEMQQR